mgnify:CR=1 FL=1
MKTASLTDAKNQFSSLIDQVRHGETILILERGRPVARLTSVLDEGGSAAEGRVDRLERQGLLHRAKAPKSNQLVPDSLPEPRGAGILAALLAEREMGR